MSRPPLAIALVVIACGPSKTTTDPNPSWYRDALPIVETRCQGCHVEGGIAPFALTTYADADAHRADIAADVQSRKMPPWMPDDSCAQYKDSRRLSDDEVAKLLAWTDSGDEGDPKDAPAAPKSQALPWIDATLDPGLDYTPNGERPDDYHCFILDPQLVQNRDLIGFDIQPGLRREVHHVILYSIPMTEAQTLDAKTPEPGWTCFGGPGTHAPKTIGGWAPGTPPTLFPPGTGVTVYSGDAIVMQVHYNMANGPPAPDRTHVNLTYSQAPVPLHAQMFPMVDDSFSIPPNASGYTHGDSFQIPFSGTVWGLLPHMHVKGDHINVSLAHADGSNTCLSDIPKWDFHWQQFYFFASRTGVAFEPGSTLKIQCTWTNPTTSTVTWGEGTGDEMCLSFMYITSGQ